MNWMSWLWKEIRGNALWALACTIASATGLVGYLKGWWTELWKWFNVAPDGIKVLALYALGITLVAVATSSWLVLLRSHIKKSTPTKPEPLQETGQMYLEALRAANPPQSISAPPNLWYHVATPKGDAGPIPLRVHTATKDGVEGGVLLWIENTDVVRLDNCQVILEGFGSFNEERNEFRRPDFDARTLIEAVQLQPGQHSKKVTLVYIHVSTKTVLLVPHGTGSFGRWQDPAKWRATLRVKTGAHERVECLYIEWEPGSVPRIIEQPKGST